MVSREELGGTSAPAAPAASRPRRRRPASDGLHRDASAALFRALSEHATDLVLILEAGGAIRYASPSHRRLLGYTPAQMEGHNASEFVHPADLPAVQARTVATARIRDAVETMIFRIRHADGSWRSLEAVGANRLRDPAIRGWIVTSREITERLRMDEALRASERRYHTVVDAVPQLLWTLTPAGEVDFVNCWGRDYLGLTPAELAGMHFMQAVHPGDRARYQDLRTQALAAGAALCAEIRLRRHDGAYRWHMIQIVPLRGDDGRLLAWYSAAADVDALKQAESERAYLLVRAQAAQAAAAAAHRQLESTLERVSDGFVALGTDWHYTYVNQRGALLFGRRPEDLIGKHIWTEFPEGVGQPFHHAYQKALAEQLPSHLEDYYAPWDRWFENRIYPSPDGLSIFFHEITDRKRAEQALAAEAARRASIEAEFRRSEERLRAIVDGSSAMICLTDLDGRYILVNREVERFYGRERGAIEGQIAYDVLPAEVRDAHRIQDRLVIERNAEVTAEEQLHRDGALRTYLMQKFPLRDEHGAVCAIAGIATDITQRAQTEAVLLERERQLAEAQKVAHLGSFEWDAVADRVSWSDELYRIYGLEPQSFGATFDAFVAQIHPDDRTLVRDTIQQAIAAGGPFRMQERIIRPGGEIRHLASWGEVVHDAQGRPVRLVGICQDVTAQRKAENEILHLNETLEQRVAERTAQLREANEQLEAFSYSVSHDLRAPLRAMQGFAVALIEDYAEQLDADGQEYARRIEAAAARMDLLIADLLSYSRLSRAALTARPVALDAAVASALTQVDEDLRQRRAQVHVPPDLPWVLAHYATLVQVLANLLTNAAKFVPPHARPAITMGVEAVGPWTRLWVADNGIGIAPEHYERIFGVFERLHGVEIYPGTGIGLAIVSKGMERMGGRVGLESTVGRGSRFWIDLPAGQQGPA